MQDFLLNHDLKELEEIIKNCGQPAYQAKQLFAWLHKGADFDGMTNLSKNLRATLAETYGTNGVSIKERLCSADGTIKYLFLLSDSHIIEGVFMQYHHGNTVCISSQVGCRMGCAFCASTLHGVERNLNAGEMLGQVVAVNRDAGGGRAISNIVIMGSGEPLDNYDELVRFLRLVNHPAGLNIGARNISVSTCGLVPNVHRLADEGIQVNLALSLHAPNDELRKTLMPVASAYTVRETIDAVKYYVGKTGRRAIIEYALIRGVNDAQEYAVQLAELLRGLICHVNLIPLNAVVERELQPSDAKTIEAFRKKLDALGISVTVRRELGADISGACGQLRNRYL